jgi:hypothetical protein
MPLNRTAQNLLLVRELELDCGTRSDDGYHHRHTWLALSTLNHSVIATTRNNDVDLRSDYITTLLVVMHIREEAGHSRCAIRSLSCKGQNQTSDQERDATHPDGPNATPISGPLQRLRCMGWLGVISGLS